MDHGIRGGEVQAGAAGLETDQEERHLALLEALHRGAPVAGVAGDLHIVDGALVQFVLDQGQHAGELREQQHLASLGDQLLEHFHQAVQLARAAAAR
ncbi:hypothetical protein D9M71_607730 [compost metagenome]